MFGTQDVESWGSTELKMYTIFPVNQLPEKLKLKETHSLTVKNHIDGRDVIFTLKIIDLNTEEVKVTALAGIPGSEIIQCLFAKTIQQLFSDFVLHLKKDESKALNQEINH